MKGWLKTFALSPDQEEILRNQVIDAERPGPVLHDFQRVLDYVGTKGVKSAGKYNLLPMDAIGVLDPQLSRPLQLTLQRPQLRSHPYLQGLHLLLRASGLSRVEGTGAKARLALDPAMLEQWHQLNPTERYFNLLEAWLLVGHPEMVGEPGARFTENSLRNCLACWEHIPPQGQKFKAAQPDWIYLPGIDREFYHLALFDLFGLLEVEHPRGAVKPWCPAGVRHLPFGDAVFKLLGGWLFAPQEENDEPSEEEAGSDVWLGRWQPVFQPYFPQWRSNLTLPEEEAREGIFIFRVSLWDVWRRIAVPADATVEALVACILRSVNFDDEHLYSIAYRDRFGTTGCIQHPFMDQGPWASDVRIGELPIERGQSLTLTYDFGDNWQFDVKLESIEPPNRRLKAARVLEKHGKAPRQYGSWE